MSREDLIATWLITGGTLVLAFVAVFQETVRGWFYRPKFRVTTRTAPPDCVAVPLTNTADGSHVADCFYLRIWVENVGNATAKNVEVYAQELRRRRADQRFERVPSFPPMNLKWSNVGGMLFPSISMDMGKHCDVAHIVDPAKRAAIKGENAPALHLSHTQTSLAFDLIVTPNHRGNIVGPGRYELDILVAASNAKPRKYAIEITLEGTWDSDETRMLRDYVAIGVRET